MDNNNNAPLPNEETVNNTPVTEQQSGNTAQNPYSNANNAQQTQPTQQQPPYTPPAGTPYQAPNNTYYPPGSQPYYGVPQQKPNNGTAIASLVLGILGIFSLFFPFGIVGLILGISSKKKPGANGIATGGIITSIIAIILSLVIIVLAVIIFVNYGEEIIENSSYYSYY